MELKDIEWEGMKWICLAEGREQRGGGCCACNNNKMELKDIEWEGMKWICLAEGREQRGGGCCACNNNKLFWFRKIRRKMLLFRELRGPQEGFCSTEVVRWFGTDSK